MFTEKQLKDAHKKVKTGADFPYYIQEIKALGLVCYEYFVRDGHTIYYGENQHQVNSEPIYQGLDIAATSSITQLQNAIAIHQQGETDFMTFCTDLAKAGVEKWVVDTQNMCCTYFDTNGNAMVSEPIPVVEG